MRFSSAPTCQRRTRPGSDPGRVSGRGANVSERTNAGHRAAAAELVDDVDALVLPVRAGDPEQHRQPSERAEAPFLSELAAKDELVAEPVEVPPGLLKDPVHVHLVTNTHTCGQLDTRPLLHAF